MELIRAHERDQEVIEFANYYTLNAVKRFLGQARAMEGAHRVKLLIRFIYYALTTGIGKRTLGEEYVNIMQIPSNALKRWLLVLALVMPIQQTKLSTVISTLHLILFYFQQRHYHIAKRLLGIRYVHIHRHSAPRASYELIGLILLVNLIYSLRTTNESQENIAQRMDLENEFCAFIKDRSCPLCMTSMKDPTAAICGHLFCWNCIEEWCRRNPVCPICRRETAPQHLLALRRNKKIQ